MARHLTKSQTCLYFSLQCRRFLRVHECFCSQKRHVGTPEEKRKWGESKGAGKGGGGGEREEKITFAQSKHGLSNWTLQSKIYSSEKNVFEQAAFWHEVNKSGEGFSTASKSCPDASVEIALTFLLRNTSDILSRSNSKRLASTAGVKIRIYVRHFWIQNNSFPQLRANENGIINIDLQLIGRHQSTSPMPHQSGAPFAIVSSFPKEQWYRAGLFFSPLPLPPHFPSFALASP